MPKRAFAVPGDLGRLRRHSLKEWPNSLGEVRAMSQFCAVAVASRCGELVGYNKDLEIEWLSNCNPLMAYQHIPFNPLCSI